MSKDNIVAMVANEAAGSKRGYLNDVAALRLTLIFLLVFYHAFCPFTGAWDTPYENFPQIETYKWFGVLSHYFQLETMIFISGLLFGYALARSPERLNFNNCVTKKAKRILLPCLLFSVVYYLMFYDSNETWYIIVYKISCGCGHLWFLPMIFWCFVIAYLLERKRATPPHLVLIVSAMASIAALPVSLFGLGRTMAYFIYFHFGFCIMRGYIKFKYLSITVSLICIVIYALLIVLYEQVKGIGDTGIIWTLLRIGALRIIHLVAAMLMIFALYSLANRPSIKAALDKMPILIKLSGYCYGVYIYQQFILKYLYYDTAMPSHFTPEMLPWVGVASALLLSIVFCYLTLKTRLGRYLIG